MRSLIRWLVDHATTVFIAAAAVFVFGVLAWVTLPRESSPDITIPVVIVVVWTFGIMAGGPFVEKIEVAAELPVVDASVADVADRVEQAFSQPGDGEWALESVYRLDLPESDAVVLREGAEGALSLEVVALP